MCLGSCSGLLGTSLQRPSSVLSPCCKVAMNPHLFSPILTQVWLAELSKWNSPYSVIYSVSLRVNTKAIALTQLGDLSSTFAIFSFSLSPFLESFATTVATRPQQKNEWISNANFVLRVIFFCLDARRREICTILYLRFHLYTDLKIAR